MDFETAEIYIDLDSLQDTRAATLFQYDPSVLELNLRKDYFTRTTDEFEGIELERYRELYRKRDIKTLSIAVRTRVPRLLVDFAKDTLNASINTPFRRQPCIVINTYPYQLTRKDEESLIKAVVLSTRKMADVKLTHMPLAELTPRHVKNNYIFLVMYEYHLWLDAQANLKTWETQRCNTSMVLGPQLIQSKAAEKQLHGMPTFQAIEEVVKPFVQLKLYPALMFSLDLEVMGLQYKFNTTQ